jgi:hypothetical protein
MKKFKVNEARNGAEIVTRAGKSVKILLFDRNSNQFPIVAIIDNREVICVTAEGKYYPDKDSDKDLMMKSE